MKKKIIISLVVVLIITIISGGIFWWWQNQKDVRELNKNLPKGVKVVKSLSGKYRVVNKIDGYEFKVPDEWRGIKEIEYVFEREVNGLMATGIVLVSPAEIIVGIDQYKPNQPVIELETLIKEFFEPEGILENQQIGDYQTIKTKVERLGGAQMYFLKKDSKIYVFGGFSNKDIQKIILDGDW